MTMVFISLQNKLDGIQSLGEIEETSGASRGTYGIGKIAPLVVCILWGGLNLKGAHLLSPTNKST